MRALVAFALTLAACRTAPPAPSGASSEAIPEPSPPASQAPGRPAAPVATAPVASNGAATRDVAVAALSLALAKGLTLVKVEGPAAKTDDAVLMVTVTKTELLVGNEPIDGAVPGSRGFPAAMKRQGAQAALEVLSLGSVLKPIHRAHPDESTVRLLLDASTPYRSALEVIFTAAHSGFTSFAFVVASRSGERSVPASTPSRAEQDAERAHTAPPVPSFVFQGDGLSISVGDDVIGAGCVLGAAGVTVPSVPAGSGHLDPSALAACAARLKTMKPAWASANAASVSASPGLTMQTVLEGVTAVLPSFPVIHFGLLSG